MKKWRTQAYQLCYGARTKIRSGYKGRPHLPVKWDEQSTEETGDESHPHTWEMRGKWRSVQITDSKLPPPCRSGHLGEEFTPQKPGKAQTWSHQEPESLETGYQSGVGRDAGLKAEQGVGGPSVSSSVDPQNTSSQVKSLLQEGFFSGEDFWGFHQNDQVSA